MRATRLFDRTNATNANRAGIYPDTTMADAAGDSPYINMDPTRQYGYVPSISLAAVFLTVFGITTLLHLGQLVIARRYWWMVCMVIGGVCESP